MLQRCLCAAAALLMAGSAYAAEKDVLVTVNDQPLRREEVASRVWSLHANEALNQMVDEILIEQALAAWEPKAGKKEKDAILKETETRLKNVKDQFKDEAAFNANLQRSGVTLDSLRKQIEMQVRREHLILSAKSLSVTPAEIREFFDANKARLGAQEAVHLRHILVASEQQARDLLTAVRVGADFAKLSREVSLDAGLKERGGDLGFINRGMLLPEIEKIVFALKPGEVSDVVRSALGFHIFKAEERREAREVQFKDVEKDLAQALLAQKVNQAWPVYLKELRDAAKIVPSDEVTRIQPEKAPEQKPAPSAAR